MALAGAGWSTNGSLKAALLSRGWEFEFPQAVMLLEQLQAGAVPAGKWGPFGEEAIRFAPASKLAPTACTVQTIAPLEETDSHVDRCRVTISFFGLYGMCAPGPAYIFETASSAGDSDQGRLLRDFLDLFNNRMIALYYRAWRKYRWPVEFRKGGTDQMTRRAFAFLGLATPLQSTHEGRRQILADHHSLRPIVPSPRLLRYIGLFSQRARCPANLRGLLWDYFDGPDIRREEFVEVEEFVPRWLFIEQERQCRLGQANSRLGGQEDSGEELLMGERIRECLGQFRIVVGPLDLETFRTFLPNGAAYWALQALADLYRPDRLDYDIKLRLRADQVPPLRIGGGAEERLGWSTWVRTPGVRRRDEGVVVFRRRKPDSVELSKTDRTAA